MVTLFTTPPLVRISSTLQTRLLLPAVVSRLIVVVAGTRAVPVLSANTMSVIDSGNPGTRLAGWARRQVAPPCPLQPPKPVPVVGPNVGFGNVFGIPRIRAGKSV